MIFHLTTSSILLIIGMCGVSVSRKSVISTIMSPEVMLLSASFNLVFSSTYLDDIIGHLSTSSVPAVGASESAIGSALVVSYYRLYE
jgi:NADH-quinone oxidoreductase subunit K